MRDITAFIDQNTGDCIEVVGGFISDAFGEG
jgi:hypothetical protein